MFAIISYSDAQIIESIRSSSRKSDRMIQYILDENRIRIKTYVLKNNGNDSDAEEVLIEGVTNLIFNIRKDSFRGDSHLSTYLYTICKRGWLKKLKERSKFQELDDNSEESDDNDSPFFFFSNQQMKDEVRFLLGHLGEACQHVLKFWSQHYSMKEIAARMNYKNAQIAMNKKNKCMGKLKEIAKKNRAYREELNAYLN